METAIQHSLSVLYATNTPVDYFFVVVVVVFSIWNTG